MTLRKIDIQPYRNNVYHKGARPDFRNTKFSPYDLLYLHLAYSMYHIYGDLWYERPGANPQPTAREADTLTN